MPGMKVPTRSPQAKARGPGSMLEAFEKQGPEKTVFCPGIQGKPDPIL
ncbi:MAG: hypothetical protein HFE84_02935 [Lachnospiraceae bacterium]|nr:hypothetical protein [Lachnospiraceae bacterium]